MSLGFFGENKGTQIFDKQKICGQTYQNFLEKFDQVSAM